MHAASAPIVAATGSSGRHVTLFPRDLEEKLKGLGISIVSSKQDTVFSVTIKGLAGKALLDGLAYADLFLQEKVKSVLKMHVDGTSKRFVERLAPPPPTPVAPVLKNGTSVKNILLGSC